MSTFFRIEMFVIAFVFFLFIVRLINKNIFLLKNTAIWLVTSIILVLFSIFPEIPNLLSNFLGFEETSNFLYFCAVAFLIVTVLLNAILASRQDIKINTLTQELSIIKSKLEEQERN